MSDTIMLTMLCEDCGREILVPLQDSDIDIDIAICAECSRTGKMVRITVDGRFLGPVPF